MRYVLRAARAARRFRVQRALRVDSDMRARRAGGARYSYAARAPAR